MALSHRAHAAVRYAIHRGVLPHASTQTCVDCGNRAQDYDHRDYHKPLEVDPVCHSCNVRRGPAIGSDALDGPAARAGGSDVVPAIVRLVSHHGGPTAVSRLLPGQPVYQEIQRWLARGWASPMHILALRPLAPEGITVDDLYADRARAPARKERAPANRRNKGVSRATQGA